MKEMAIGLMAALALGGCAASKPASSDTDTAAFNVECPRTRLDLCFAKAARLCPHGYDETKPSAGGPVDDPPDPVAKAQPRVSDVSPSSLYIVCK